MRVYIANVRTMGCRMEDIRNRTHGGKKDESVNATIKSVDIYLVVMHYAFMRNEVTQEIRIIDVCYHKCVYIC